MNFDEVVGKIIEGGCLQSIAKFKVAHYLRAAHLTFLAARTTTRLGVDFLFSARIVD
jgi:hypothetical protein